MLRGVFPDISPSTGGMLLEVKGSDLGGGSDYRCYFGRTPLPPLAGPDRRPPLLGYNSTATYDAESGAVLCHSPAGLLGYIDISLSLNGQQFADASPKPPTLEFYNPEQQGSLPYYGADPYPDLKPMHEIHKPLWAEPPAGRLSDAGGFLELNRQPRVAQTFDDFEQTP